MSMGDGALPADDDGAQAATESNAVVISSDESRLRFTRATEGRTDVADFMSDSV